MRCHDTYDCICTFNYGTTTLLYGEKWILILEAVVTNENIYAYHLSQKYFKYPRF